MGGRERLGVYARRGRHGVDVEADEAARLPDNELAVGENFVGADDDAAGDASAPGNALQ